MLSPRPDRPLDISIVISWPGMIGHIAGSTGGGKLSAAKNKKNYSIQLEELCKHIAEEYVS